jgi:hypothetical protein
MQCEACRNNCQKLRKLKSHIGVMHEERGIHFEFCESKDVVIGKLKEQECLGTFKKHEETLHCIASLYNDRKCRKTLENVRKCRKPI